jgi:hypothetical protein
MLAARQNRANGAQAEPEAFQAQAQDQMAMLEAEAEQQQAQMKPSLQFVKATVTAPKELPKVSTNILRTGQPFPHTRAYRTQKIHGPPLFRIQTRSISMATTMMMTRTRRTMRLRCNHFHPLCWIASSRRESF